MVRMWFLVVFMILSNACAHVDESNAEKLSAQRAIESAASAYAESQEAGHAWRAARLYLEAARGALERGEYALAVAEADRSLQVAQASLTQARVETEVWEANFPAKR